MKIDITKTILSAVYEYEARNGFSDYLTVFVNRAFYQQIMEYWDITHRIFNVYERDMKICGYPMEIVYDHNDTPKFWIGEQKLIYAEEER